MAISYEAGPLAPFNVFLTGDGTSDTLVIDLSNPPFSLDLKGAPPILRARAEVLNIPAGITLASSTASGSKVTFTFSAPLPTNVDSTTLAIHIEFASL